MIRVVKVGVSSIDASPSPLRAHAPCVPGHSFVGVVEAIGEEVVKKWLGRRIVASPIISCGRCDRCHAGLAMHCRERAILGLAGRDGGLADRIVLPVTALHEVSDRIDDDDAALVALVASALQAARVLRLEGRPYITVLGDGPLGLLAAHFMSRLNASVRLVGHHEHKLALCEKWGIKHRHADEVGRRADQDIVVDCTGTGEGFELATKLVRPRGRILLKSLATCDGPGEAGVHRLMPVVLDEIEVIGSFGGSVREALFALERREVEVAGLITRRLRFSDGLAILKAASQPEAVVTLVEIQAPSA